MVWERDQFCVVFFAILTCPPGQTLTFRRWLGWEPSWTVLVLLVHTVNCLLKDGQSGRFGRNTGGWASIVTRFNTDKLNNVRLGHVGGLIAYPWLYRGQYLLGQVEGLWSLPCTLCSEKYQVMLNAATFSRDTPPSLMTIGRMGGTQAWPLQHRRFKDLVTWGQVVNKECIEHIVSNQASPQLAQLNCEELECLVVVTSYTFQLRHQNHTHPYTKICATVLE